MFLYASKLQGVDTFRLMPISNDCPYMVGVFVPQTQHLIFESVAVRENLHLVKVLDDQGDEAKSKKPRTTTDPTNGQPVTINYREKQMLMRDPSEYYITEKEDVEKMINTIAVNASEFDFKKYFKSDIIVPEQSKLILPGQ